MPLLAVGLFLAVQGGAGLLMMPFMGVIKSQTLLISVALILSSLASILLMWRPMKMLDVQKEVTRDGLNRRFVMLSVSTALIGIFGTNVLSELMELPDILEADFSALSHTVLGVIGIGILGPITEEVVFRGSIQGWLHKHGYSPWAAILTTALLFGLIHFNPAQVPFAALIGIILGVVYWKSGSLILPCLIHVINNSVACYLMVTDPEASLVDLFGGTSIALIAGLACLTIAAMGIWQMMRMEH